MTAPPQGTAYVLTNAHAIAAVMPVQDPADLTISASNGVVYQTVEVSAYDPKADLALIHICCDLAFERVPFAGRGDVARGTPVLTAGFPMPYLEYPTYTAGIVSAIRNNEAKGRTEIQTDAALNLGSSGGPLLSSEGCLLGINTYVIREAGPEPIEGVGFAIGNDTLDRFLRDSIGYSVDDLTDVRGCVR